MNQILKENDALIFGKYVSHLMYKTPKRALQMLSYYKFVANFIPPGKKILEIGCNEGFGTWLLSKNASSVTAVDFDKDAIETAKTLWKDPKLEFIANDFRAIEKQAYDIVILFDVVEHIFPENFPEFFQNLLDCLPQDGMLVIGKPSLEQQKYASKLARQGHVNCMTGQVLEDLIDQFFHHTFIFCGNDELVHTGFWPMANYLLGIGYSKK